MERVGILLNRTQLHRILAGRRTFEKAHLYTKAAQELGVELVFFSTDGVHRKGRHIHGYIPTKRHHYKLSVVPLPKAIHRRGLYYFNTSRERRTVNWLMSHGAKVYNSFAPLDKYSTYKLLFNTPTIREHLPLTCLLKRSSYPHFRDLLETGGEVFIKPRGGTVGVGIVRVRKLADGRYRYETRRRHITTSLVGAWRLVIRGRSHGFILQQGIALAHYKGKRYDLRVPVQRGKNGCWVVPGMVAKRAGRIPFLTNLARGGSAHKGYQVLSESVPGVSGEELYGRVENLAIMVAEAIGRKHQGIADLGLDIGVDENGTPWLIEVNRRDLRYSFLEAKEHAAYEKIFANPIAYGKYIVQSAKHGAVANDSKVTEVLRCCYTYHGIHSE